MIKSTPIEHYDTRAIAVKTDVSEYNDAVEMVETIVDEFGQRDCLINNARVGESKPFVETDPELWDKIIGVCQYGTLNCSHATLDQMNERETGTITNFASDLYRKTPSIFQTNTDNRVGF